VHDHAGSGSLHHDGQPSWCTALVTNCSRHERCTQHMRSTFVYGDSTNIRCVSQVNWQTVLWGIGLQFVFAIAVLRWPAGYAAFKWLGDRVSKFLAYTDTGSKFVFGDSYRDHLFAFQASNRF